MDDWTEQEYMEIEMDPHTVDCADVFSTILGRRFPEITLENAISTTTPWRILIRVNVPRTVSAERFSEIDTYAFDTMLEWFDKTGVLTTYTVEYEREDDVSGTETDD